MITIKKSNKIQDSKNRAILLKELVVKNKNNLISFEKFKSLKKAKSFPKNGLYLIVDEKDEISGFPRILRVGISTKIYERIGQHSKEGTVSSKGSSFRGNVFSSIYKKLYFDDDNIVNKLEVAFPRTGINSPVETFEEVNKSYISLSNRNNRNIYRIQNPKLFEKINTLVDEYMEKLKVLIIKTKITPKNKFTKSLEEDIVKVYYDNFIKSNNFKNDKWLGNFSTVSYKNGNSIKEGYMWNEDELRKIIFTQQEKSIDFDLSYDVFKETLKNVYSINEKQ